MGQYHLILNLTKKERITPHRMGDGAKLLEFGMSVTAQGLILLLANSNGRGGGDLYIRRDFDEETGELLPLDNKRKALQDDIDAISGRWSGDKIVIQGDYAEKGDPSFVSEKRLQDFHDISDLVVKALATDEHLLKTHLEEGYLVEKYVKPILRS